MTVPNYNSLVRLASPDDILLHFLSSKRCQSGDTCSVRDCSHPAQYEVLLYDYYAESQEQFLRTDSTCPFLCQTHFLENEAERVGERRPRAVVRYPYTNQERAQGFSRYIPIDPTRLSERTPPMTDKPLIQFTGQKAMPDYDYGGTRYTDPALIFANPAEIDHYLFQDAQPEQDSRSAKQARGELYMRSETMFLVQGEEATRVAKLLAEFALSTAD